MAKRPLSLEGTRPVTGRPNKENQVVLGYNEVVLGNLKRLSYSNDRARPRKRDNESLRHEAGVLMKSNNDMETDLFSLKREKIKLNAYADGLKRQLESKNSECAMLIRENRELGEKVNALKQLVHKTSFEKSVLRNSCTPPEGLLQEPLAEKLNKSEHLVRDKSNSKVLVKEILQELHLKSPSEIVGKIRNLNEEAKSGLLHRKFIGRMKSLFITFSPSYGNDPSLRRIWKWVTGLTKEYMKVANELSAYRQSFETVKQLKGALKVCCADDIISTIQLNKIDNKIFKKRMKSIYKIMDLQKNEPFEALKGKLLEVLSKSDTIYL